MSTYLSLFEALLAAAFIGTQVYFVFNQAHKMKPLKQKAKIEERRRV